MSNKDLAEMMDIAFGILITLGGILWLWLYLKLDKIYDELKEIRKEKKENIHGNWLENENGTYSCSICHSCISKEQYCYDSRYCIHCGADMREERKDTEW